MFELIEFWGMNENVIGVFATREDAMAKAKEVHLIGSCKATCGEEGGIIRHDGNDEIL